MALVTRGTKAGTGTTDFGSTTALSDEVNIDLNTLYTLVNGNLDAANLAANAVSATEIQALAVTTPKLDNLAVTTAKLDDLAVTLGKIAVGGSLADVVYTSSSTPITVTVATEGNGTTGAPLLEDTWTGRGGTVLTYGRILGRVVNANTRPDGIFITNLASRIRIDGSAGVADGTLIGGGGTQYSGVIPTVPVVVIGVPFTLPAIGITDSLTGTHRVKLTFEAQTFDNVVVEIFHTVLVLVEFA